MSKNKDYVTFQQAFNHYSSLDFNKVIFKGKTRLLLFAIGAGILVAIPGFYITKIVTNEILQTVSLIFTMLGIFVLYVRYIMNPYVRKRGKELNIKVAKGFTPLEYRPYVLKEMEKHLNDVKINNYELLKSLIDRAHKKADSYQKATFFLNNPLSISLSTSVFILLIQWYFEQYINSVEDPTQNLLDLLKYIAVTIFLISGISYMINTFLHESTMRPKSKYLNFADVLEDIILNNKPSK